MKKIKFISILLAGMIITIDSVRAGAEGKKEVKIRYKVGKEKGKKYKQHKAIKKDDESFKNIISLKNLKGNDTNQQALIDGLDKTELKGTVKELIAKIEANIDQSYQVLSVQRYSLFLFSILLDQNLDLSNCSFETGDRSLWIYLVPKSDEISLLNPKTESRWSEYPRVYSFCVTTIFIFLIGGICLYHNLSALKGEKLARKSSWKCRWKAINAMRLSRMLFFFTQIILFCIGGMQLCYLARFGGYYFYLNNLIFGLLFLFLINLRCNDAKLSKWWLVSFAVPIIYAHIVSILSFKPHQIILLIIGLIVFIDAIGSLYLTHSPSIPDEKKKAMKEEEDDTFINSTTDIAN